MTPRTRSPLWAVFSTIALLAVILTAGVAIQESIAEELLPSNGHALLDAGDPSPENRLAIERLLSLYAHLYDDYETKAWSTLFVEDATFEIAYRKGGPHARSVWNGRQEILSHLAPRRAQFRAEGVGKRHYLANPLVYELRQDKARVSAYLLLTTIHPDGKVVLSGSGRYDGRVIKTSAGWRIQSWRFTPDGDPVDFAGGL